MWPNPDIADAGLGLESLELPGAVAGLAARESLRRAAPPAVVRCLARTTEGGRTGESMKPNSSSTFDGSSVLLFKAAACFAELDA